MKTITNTFLLLVGTLTITCFNSCVQKTEPKVDNSEKVEEIVNEVESEPEAILNESTLDTVEILSNIQSGTLAFDFYVSITEPFWTFYFVDEGVLFYGMDESLVLYEASDRFDASKDEQMIVLTNGKEQRHLFIVKEEGSDGMSDIVYPYSVTVDNEWHGGGAEDYLKESYE